jgi:hypothetical protein
MDQKPGEGQLANRTLSSRKITLPWSWTIPQKRICDFGRIDKEKIVNVLIGDRCSTSAFRSNNRQSRK